MTVHIMIHCLNIFTCLRSPLSKNLAVGVATVLVFAGFAVPPTMSQDANNSSAGQAPKQVTTPGKVEDAAFRRKRSKKAEIERFSNDGSHTNVQIRLSGSLCIGCLVELERKLKLMPGIARAKVDIPGTGGFYDNYGGPGASGIITATMSYDPSKISMDQVEDFIRTQGYTLRRVIER